MMRIALFLLTNLAVMVVFGLVLSLTGIQSSSMTGLLIMALLFGFGGSIVSLMMSKWMALKSVGGEVIEQPRNETERWLMHTVAQQAQQAGIAMPQVAIYHAPDINAFATGARRDASLVAVSTGLLQNMSRDEAEAVIAHEISHIANGDMVTMTLIQGVVNTFVIFISRVIAQIAAGFLGGNREDEGESSNGNPLIYFAVATVLELVFGILASIITMWFSRHREFHADAGSARLVGREKMIAALQRLKTSYEPQEASSMMAFCINGKAKSMSELFMTHPPLDKRIEALRSGEYLEVIRRFDAKNKNPQPESCGFFCRRLSGRARLGDAQTANQCGNGRQNAGQQQGGMGAAVAEQVEQQGDQRRASALTEQASGTQHPAGATATMARSRGDNSVVIRRLETARNRRRTAPYAR